MMKNVYNNDVNKDLFIVIYWVLLILVKYVIKRERKFKMDWNIEFYWKYKVKNN